MELKHGALRPSIRNNIRQRSNRAPRWKTPGAPPLGGLEAELHPGAALVCTSVETARVQAPVAA